MAEMTNKAKELRQAYQREWRARNREKIQVYNKRYWERRAAAADQADREDERQVKDDAEV